MIAPGARRDAAVLALALARRRLDLVKRLAKRQLAARTGVGGVVLILGLVEPILVAIEYLVAEP